MPYGSQLTQFSTCVFVFLQHIMKSGKMRSNHDKVRNNFLFASSYDLNVLIMSQTHTHTEKQQIKWKIINSLLSAFLMLLIIIAFISTSWVDYQVVRLIIQLPRNCLSFLRFFLCTSAMVVTVVKSCATSARQRHLEPLGLLLQ